MIAFKLGLEESGMGGGAPAFIFGADSEVTAEGRFIGTGGGAGSLLLKPISNADLRGGGTIALFARLVNGVSFEACLWGSDGGSRVDCLGGNEGLAGRSTYLSSVTFPHRSPFDVDWVAAHYSRAQIDQTSSNPLRSAFRDSPGVNFGGRAWLGT